MTDLIARLNEVSDWPGWRFANRDDEYTLRDLLREAASALGREEREGVIEECAKVSCQLCRVGKVAVAGFHSVVDVPGHMKDVECPAWAIRSLKSSPQGEKQREDHPSVTNDPERGASAALALPNAGFSTQHNQGDDDARGREANSREGNGESGLSESGAGIGGGRAVDGRIGTPERQDDSAGASASPSAGSGPTGGVGASDSGELPDGRGCGPVGTGGSEPQVAAPAPGLGELPMSWRDRVTKFQPNANMSDSMGWMMDEISDWRRHVERLAARMAEMTDFSSELQRMLFLLAKSEPIPARFKEVAPYAYEKAKAAEAALAAENESVQYWRDLFYKRDEEYKRFAEQLEECGKLLMGEHDAHMQCHRDLAAERSRAGEMRKDAERYRWLRDESYRTPIAPGPLYRSLYDGIGGTALAEHLKKVWLRYGPALDAAIDAALSRETGEKQ